MADFISFDEGQNLVGVSGLPSTCRFDLSSKSVDATNPFVETDTYSTRGVITGTGYAVTTESRPTPSGGTFVFAVKSWTSGTATDWSNSVRSCVLHNGGTIISAWNLNPGGAVVDMSTANTTQLFTPTLVIGGTV